MEGSSSCNMSLLTVARQALFVEGCGPARVLDFGILYTSAGPWCQPPCSFALEAASTTRRLQTYRRCHAVLLEEGPGLGVPASLELEKWEQR